MGFPKARSQPHQRQQVVELTEMKAGVEINCDLDHAGNLNFTKSEMKPNNLPLTPNESKYETNAEEEQILSPNSDNLSRRSSHSSCESEAESILSDLQTNLHPHIRFSNLEQESLYVPSKSPSRLNAHDSIDTAEDLTKQIDSTRRDAEMTLSQKRVKKAQLVRLISERSNEKTIGLYKLFQYSFSMSFHKFRKAVGNLLHTLELWYSSLKIIEGNFGSGVASYFQFLRWLFLLNLTTLVISFSFLVLPQTLSRLYLNSNEVPDIAKNGGTYMEKSFYDIPDSNGTLPPPLTAAALLHRSNPYHDNEKFTASDIITGEGFLTATPMYYGHYKADVLELFEGYPYDLPNAYFFSMAVCYSIILISVSISMASSYRKTFIETRGPFKGNLSLKIFCGWDHSIATEEAASLNMKRLHNEIKEALNEESFKNRDVPCLIKFTNVTVQVALNIMFFFLMGGVAFIMWDLMGRHSAYLPESSHTGNTMVMAIITSLIMNILPIGFSWIVRYEDYHNPRTALYVTLMRTFFLNVVVIGTIVAFWLTHPQECWETALGQEVYRLLITDFIISILVMGLVETVWACIQRTCWKEYGAPEFDIAWNTLNLIYNETLFLVGFYFSPLLSAVIVLKLFITFYIKKAATLHNCQPPKKSWRAAQTQTLFLILTFIALLGVFVIFGYIIFWVPPSHCGPFKGFPFMYEAILKGIFQLPEDNVFWQGFMYLSKPGVVGGILIAMSIATYILRAKADALSIECNMLSNMLINETKDKAFLFKSIKRAESICQKKVSIHNAPTSPFHTPLSERRQMKKATHERQASYLFPSPAKHLATQRKFHSAGQLTPVTGSWSFRRQNVIIVDEPSQSSSSSGASTSRTTFELSDKDH